MSNQIVISSGAKVRELEGVLTGTAGIVNALGINVANGIPQLDGSGKILVSQLPNSVMEYKGTWNAATNTPTLANGTGNQGDVYLCNVAGTVDFGAGPIVFFVGDQVIYSGTIWQRASGASGTVTSVAVTETGDALSITGSPITTSGTINIGFAGTSGQYVNGAGGLTTFPSLAGYLTSVTATAPLLSSGGTTPDISIPVATSLVDGYLDSADWSTFNNKQDDITLTTTGTTGAATLIGATLNIPNYSTDLSGYVPYTGATANVNLGTFDLTADVITGATGSFASSGGSDTFAINHSSGSGIALNITKGGNGEGIYINKTSGSGNAATIIGTLNATTLVKSGGTSSQFLMADGSVNTSVLPSGAYLPLTGGTLTGALNGTSALFSSSITSNLSLLINRFSNGDYLALKIENRPITDGNNGSGFIAFYSNSGDATSNTYTTGKIYGKFDTNSYNSARLTLATVTGNEIYQDVLTAKDTNVGIGTINPAQTLHLFTTSGTGSGVGTAIQIQSAGTGADQGWVGVNKGTGNGLTLSVQTNNIIFNTGASTPFGGTERLRITNGGDVGIGTVNPSTKLDVNGTGNFSGALTGTSATFSSAVTANSLIKTGGTSAQILAADGSVITAGTNITISGGTISSTGAITGSGTTNYVAKFTGASSIGNSLIFDNGTNVGIGQISPSYKLDVQDNGVSGIVDVASFSVTGNGGSGRGVGILIGAAGSSNSVQVARLVGYQELANPVAVAASFAIQVANSSGTLTERLRITQAGNLLIGSTTDNGSRLQVTGAATFSSSVTATAGIFNLNTTNGGFKVTGVSATPSTLSYLANNYFAKFFTRSDQNYGITIFDQSEATAIQSADLVNGNNAKALILNPYGGNVGIGTSSPGEKLTINGGLGFQYSGTQNWHIASNASNNLSFTRSGIADRMVITSDGNVGIGTSSPQGALEVVGLSYFTRSSQTTLLNPNYGGSGTHSQIQVVGNMALAFATNGDNERMRITSGGDLGLGTSSISWASTNRRVLEINGVSQTLLGLKIGDTQRMYLYVDGANGYLYNASGAFYVTSGTAGVYLSNGGTSWTANSDERLKNINGNIENAVEKIKTLRAVNFSWKSDETKKENLGLIAQDVEKVFPQVIDKNKLPIKAGEEQTDETEYLGVRYQELVPVLIAAIQEQQAQIEELKKLINK